MKRKGLPWFRFYVNAIDDLEISKLSDGLYRIWVGMMCLTSEHGGTLPAADVIAFRLRRSEKSINEALKKLIEVGLLDATDAGTRPHNWDTFQYKSDNSTERANASKQRKRNVGCNVAGTLGATAPEREGDTDTESEAESEESESESATAAHPAHPASLLKTGWPLDFKLTPDLLKYAASKNIDFLAAEATFIKFRNNHQAKGSMFADWSAAWRTWVDREHRFIVAAEQRNTGF
jgi:hypothetical protein